MSFLIGATEPIFRLEQKYCSNGVQNGNHRCISMDANKTSMDEAFLRSCASNAKSWQILIECCACKIKRSVYTISLYVCAYIWVQ